MTLQTPINKEYLFYEESLSVKMNNLKAYFVSFILTLRLVVLLSNSIVSRSRGKISM